MSDPAQAEKAPPKRLKRMVGSVVALAVLVAFIAYWLGRGRESTDDAFIEGHVMQISPKISEKVSRVFVDDNQTVHRGDLLVELDARDTRALYDQAAANLASAEAKLTQARAQSDSAQSSLEQARADVNESKALADNAEQELARSKSLRGSGAIAQREYDKALAVELSTKAAYISKQQKTSVSESEVKVAAASTISAQAQVDQAKALLETTRLRLDNTRIFAPDDGRITRKNVEPGNYVQPGNALMAIVGPEVWVVANFKETQLARMRPGQAVEVRVDSYPGLRLPGRVDSVQAGTGSRFSLLPPENATGNYVKVVQRIPVKITLKIPDGAPLLAPGMSVSPTVRVR